MDLAVDSILMLKKHGKLNVNEKDIYFCNRELLYVCLHNFLLHFLQGIIKKSESRRGKAFRKNNSRNRLFPAPPSIPDTNFDCANFEFPGLYADTEANCEVSKLYWVRNGKT